MNYKTIKMEYHYKKDRFNRTIMVREDINLIELGCVMCTALRTEFEHNFLFRSNKKEYLPDCFLQDYVDEKHEFPMKFYSLKDLGDKFVFTYDTGDNWTFDCKVLKKEKTVVGAEFGYLVDGKGQGIWEDNACSLLMYLDGEVDPNSNEEDEERGLYLPWNFEIEKYSDFDTVFNIAEEKEIFDATVDSNIDMYLDGMHEAGFELEVKSRTQEVLDNMYEDEYEDDVVNVRLNTLIMKVIDEQINTVDYVNKKYKELLMKYDDLTARNLIGQVLVGEIYNAMKENKPSDEKKYKKKIEKIK